MKNYRKIKSLKFMYEVSQDGEIRNVKSKKVLKPYYQKDGYVRYATKINGKDVHIFQHRAVAECWIPIPKEYEELGLTMDDLQVNHKDFNRSNNNYKNLEWLTPKENSLYSYNNGRYQDIKIALDKRKETLHDQRNNKYTNKKIQAINIKTNEVLVFKDLEEASNYYTKLLNKKYTTVRIGILRVLLNKRKVAYKTEFKFI